MIGRRQFLLGGAGMLGISATYGKVVEPSWFETTRRRVNFFGMPGGEAVRVLALSDLHYSKNVPLEMIERAIRLGLAQEPDLILLGGDYAFPIYGLAFDDAAYVKTLSPLAARAPVFACFGNHDLPVGWGENTRLLKILTAAGANVLHNRAERLNIKGREFLLVGLGDLWLNQCVPHQAFPDNDEHLPRLVLSHNPDSKELLGKYRWNLMVCGHTHGGQLRLPLIGTPLAPVKDMRYVAGLNEWRGRWIYTTRGIGNLHGTRINCRPEVTLLELV